MSRVANATAQAMAVITGPFGIRLANIGVDGLGWRREADLLPNWKDDILRAGGLNGMHP